MARNAVDPASRHNGLIGGNADLIPRVADTYTAGVVLQPRFLPRFALTGDWFAISGQDAVTDSGADTILNAWEQTLDPTFCGLINRDGGGSLRLTCGCFVTNPMQSIGGLSMAGIDGNANYNTIWAAWVRSASTSWAPGSANWLPKQASPAPMTAPGFTTTSAARPTRMAPYGAPELHQPHRPGVLRSAGAIRPGEHRCAR